MKLTGLERPKGRPIYGREHHDKETKTTTITEDIRQHGKENHDKQTDIDMTINEEGKEADKTNGKGFIIVTGKDNNKPTANDIETQYCAPCDDEKRFTHTWIINNIGKDASERN